MQSRQNSARQAKITSINFIIWLLLFGWMSLGFIETTETRDACIFVWVGSFGRFVVRQCTQNNSHKVEFEKCVQYFFAFGRFLWMNVCARLQSQKRAKNPLCLPGTLYGFHSDRCIIFFKNILYDRHGKSRYIKVHTYLTNRSPQMNRINMKRRRRQTIHIMHNICLVSSLSFAGRCVALDYLKPKRNHFISFQRKNLVISARMINFHCCIPQLWNIHSWDWVSRRLIFLMLLNGCCFWLWVVLDLWYVASNLSEYMINTCRNKWPVAWNWFFILTFGRDARTHLMWNNDAKIPNKIWSR